MSFVPLLSPNFIPNFGKIIGAVPEIILYAPTYARTDAREWYYTFFIGFFFSPKSDRKFTNFLGEKKGAKFPNFSKYLLISLYFLYLGKKLLSFLKIGENWFLIFFYKNRSEIRKMQFPIKTKVYRTYGFQPGTNKLFFQLLVWNL